MCLSWQGGLIIVFGAVEGLLLFLCGSAEYDELTLADMLSTLAKSIVSLCRQGGKNQRATESVSVNDTDSHGVWTMECSIELQRFWRPYTGRHQVAPCIRLDFFYIFLEHQISSTVLGDREKQPSKDGSVRTPADTRCPASVCESEVNLHNSLHNTARSFDAPTLTLPCFVSYCACSSLCFLPLGHRSVPLSPRRFNRLYGHTLTTACQPPPEKVFLSSSIYSKACLVVDEMIPGGILESLDPDSILSAVKLQK